MSNIILFDGQSRDYLLPLTYSRPVASLRLGILTIAEKWARHLSMPASFLTQDYLRELFPLVVEDRNLLINGDVLPTPELLSLVRKLTPGQACRYDGELIAACVERPTVEAIAKGEELREEETLVPGEQSLIRIKHPGDIFSLNGAAIEADFALLTAGRTSAELSSTNTVIGPRENLFVEEGARAEACIFNVEDGPVYLGKDCVLLEGSLLRSPLSVGPRAVIKMGAKVYGATTIGPGAKVGGEVNNVVFYGNCNKGHDGFLGNAVIGEWCNIGADTNASNLRNDYGEVKVWSYPGERFAKTGKQFHGLIMADHSKAGINTMLNTGTVIGFSANVYGEGFPRTFIPSFSWGGATGYVTYRKDKALATAQRVMLRRNEAVTPAHERLFDAVFEASQPFRRWEK